MTKGPLRSSQKSDIEYWAKSLFGKRYEYLTDLQAEICWDMMKGFLLEWQEEMLHVKGA